MPIRSPTLCGSSSAKAQLREVAALDRLPEIASVEIRIFARDLLRFIPCGYTYDPPTEVLAVPFIGAVNLDVFLSGSAQTTSEIPEPASGLLCTGLMALACSGRWYRHRKGQIR
jgi:hypothetical protein